MSIAHAQRPQVARPPRPARPLRKWLGLGAFAVLAATFVHWAVFEAYVIPSASMEHSLLVGDYVLISKLHYGPLTPQTPLQIPLVFQQLPGLGWPSYSAALQLPTYRLPGFSTIQRNDVVVFHLPTEQQRPADLRTHLIKRCVAVAGDTVAIRRGQVVVNGQPSPVAGEPQATYFVEIAGPDDAVRQALQAQQLHDYTQPDGLPALTTDPATGKLGYLISCPAGVAGHLRRLPGVRSLTAAGGTGLVLFPDAADFPVPGARSAVPRRWQLDNYGPLPVPRQGQVIALTPANAAFYYKIISQYERNQDVIWLNGMLWQNGQPLTHYTIKQNYYFVLGDNRHASEDSRFWGFVPADHVVGKAVLVWLSLDPYADFWHQFRWSRMGRAIE